MYLHCLLPSPLPYHTTPHLTPERRYREGHDEIGQTRRPPYLGSRNRTATTSYGVHYAHLPPRLTLPHCASLRLSRITPRSRCTPTPTPIPTPVPTTPIILVRKCDCALAAPHLVRLDFTTTLPATASFTQASIYLSLRQPTAHSVCSPLSDHLFTVRTTLRINWGAADSLACLEADLSTDNDLEPSSPLPRF